MRLFLLAVLAAVLAGVFGCSDGKLNLLLVMRNDRDEEEPTVWPEVSSQAHPNSSSAQSSFSVAQSSGAEEKSSSGEISPYSSAAALSSSGEQAASSSSGRGIRSSASKVDSNGNSYEDYPTLEPGAPNVKKGWATRYWDACKPHCSWLQHNVDRSNPKPWAGICKNCDKNNKEVTTYMRHPEWTDGLWWAGYLSTPSACSSDDANAAYTCWDMAPIAINDTLAYGFAAMNPAIAQCGSCYQLEFDGGWYDEPMPRPTHRALQGKTMIVMASNVGADVQYDVEMKHGIETGTQFDIMIPGGGVGAFNALTKQIGVSVSDLGVGFGGALSNCIEGKIGEMYGVRDGSHRATLEQWQGCLKSECDRIFAGKGNELYEGCLWHVNWLLAADNPTLYYKKVDCPKYLIDKYYSSIDTAPPPLPDPYPQNGLCMIEGSIDCKQTGWYD
jgi:hypothetical protein